MPRAEPCASTARLWSASPISALALDFELACAAIAVAREEAALASRPQLAPPVPLEACQQAVIETALAAPFAGVVDREFYPALEEKAAVLLFTLAKCQACEDGNKRAAVILLQAFLALNGYTLATSNQSVVDVVLLAEASAGRDREDTLANMTVWMRESIVPHTEDFGG